MRTETIARGARRAYRSATTGMTGALLAQAMRGRTIDFAGEAGGSAFGTIATRLGDGMISAIDFALNQFATDAAVRADVTRVVRAGLDEKALERQLIRDHQWRNGTIGAVSGLPAVIPALGTSVELGVAIADEARMTVAETRMILALAHLRGLDVQDTPRRRLDILVILGLAAGVGEVRHEDGVIRIAGQDLTIAFLRDDDLPKETVVALCSAIGTDIVRRVARRRAAGLVLRLMPAGISVVSAAVGDWKMTRAVGRQAVAYYDLIAPVTAASDAARTR